jgi:hypothetical protein
MFARTRVHKCRYVRLTACLRESKLFHADSIVELSSASRTVRILDNLLVKPPAGEAGGFSASGAYWGESVYPDTKVLGGCGLSSMNG